MRCLAAAVLVLAVPLTADAQARKGAAKKPAAPPLKPVVEVAGVRVTGPRHFNWSKGTSIVAVVTVQAPYGLVGMSKEKSSLQITDAQGQPLEEPEVDWNPDFSKDNLSAIVDLDAKGLAAPGTSHLNAKGTLMFTVATGTKTIKAPSVKLVKDTPVKLGTATLTLGDIDKAGFGDGPLVMFQGTSPVIKSIKAIRAKDAKGAEVEASWSSSGTWHGEDGYQTTFKFKTAAETPALSLEFEVWDGLREVPVAFDLKAGVGIAP